MRQFDSQKVFTKTSISYMLHNSIKWKGISKETEKAETAKRIQHLILIPEKHYFH